MFITPLKFEEVLNRFYHQRKYELMLLFVSSFDGNDRIILKEIVDNAKRIDRIIGKGICFFYFIQDNNSQSDMNKSLERWVRNISDWRPLYGEGIRATMETADDICRHFGILRSYLPAFILVGKDRIPRYQLLTIHEYQDFERFLTPLNILHSYIEDKDSLISQNEHQSGYLPISQNPDSFPSKDQEEADDFSLSLLDNLETIQQKAIKKLDMALGPSDGKRIIQLLNTPNGYSEAVWSIMQLINQRPIIDSTFSQGKITDKTETDYKIFISYKRIDKDKVFKIKDIIEDSTMQKCWIDLDGIESDAQFATVIINAINNAEVFLFMYSHSHSQIENYDTDWTVREINFAQKKGKRIVFVNIDGAGLTDWFELMFGTKQQIDASSNTQMDKLCKDLRFWLNHQGGN